MAPIGKVYGPVDWHPWVQAIVVVGNFAGVEVETAPFEHFKDNKTPEYLAKFPMGRVPAFEGADGYLLTETVAIMRYVASHNRAAGLLGTDAHSAALVEQWTSFVEKEVTVHTVRVNQLCKGLADMKPYNKGLHTALLAQQATALALLEKHLTANTFLVGERPTVADIVLAHTMSFTVQMVFGPAERAQYPAVMRHLETLLYAQQTKGVFGEKIPYAEKALTYQPPQKEKKAE